MAKERGYLNPYRKYHKQSDEDVDIRLVRTMSHANFSFHLPIPKDFDRRTVLPAEQMRLLKEMAAKIQWRIRQLDILTNENKYVAADICDEIIDQAGEVLFRTPRLTEIPVDSFNEDYVVQDMEKIEADLGLKDIEEINGSSDQCHLSQRDGVDRPKQAKCKGKHKSKRHRARMRRGSSIETVQPAASGNVEVSKNS